MGECDTIELKELQIQATCFAVDVRGKLVVLCSRRYLAVISISLDDTCTLVKKVARTGKWDVGACVWSPNVGNSDLFALTSNQKIELLSWSRDSLHNSQSVVAHSRIVSDIDWSPFQQNLLASASVGEYICIWDLRNLKKPSHSFSVAAGASQLRFCRLEDNILVSCLEGDIRVWDLRKLSYPIGISAHIGKIHGIDWSYQQESVVLSASQDCTVKMWNYKKPQEPLLTITTQLPFWRAKFSPVGSGIVTTAVPQMRRGDNSLNLWSLANLASPSAVHQFLGHSDTVLDFRWRPLYSMNSWQLVSLSKDSTLRLWNISDYFRQLQPSMPVEVSGGGVGGAGNGDNNKSALGTSEIHSTSTVAAANAPNGRSSLPGYSSLNLQKEFAALEKLSIPSVTVELINVKTRSVTVSCRTNVHFIRLSIFGQEWSMAPKHLSIAPPLSFVFSKGTTLNTSARAALLKQLHNVCRQYSSTSGLCLVNCIKLLSTFTAPAVGSYKDKSAENSSPTLSSQETFSMMRMLSVPAHDASVPFPRTNGGRFSSVGILVCFGLFYAHGTEAFQTPKAMYAMQRNRNEDTSRSAYYQSEKTLSKRKSGKHVKFSDVYIYDVHSILPVSKELAETYIVSDSNRTVACNNNAEAAALINRKDLSQMWAIMGQIVDSKLSSSPKPDDSMPWSMHPFGRELVEKYMHHYWLFGDVQTVALLACVLGDKFIDDSSSVTQKPEQRIVASKPSNEVQAPQVATDTISSLYSFVANKPKRPRKFQALFAGSLYNTVATTSAESMIESVKQFVRHRSNSVGELQEDAPALPPWSFGDKEISSGNAVCSAVSELSLHQNNCRLLNPDHALFYDSIKRMYADLLYRWGLLNKHAEVMKFVKPFVDAQETIVCDSFCPRCGEQSHMQPQCKNCRQIVFRCVICEMTVKGLVTVCPLCGHGGHVDHVAAWFKQYDRCATNCGCRCASAIIGAPPVL